MNYKKYALISVYEKKKILNICKILNKFNIGIISTGLTSKIIKKGGYNCKTISSLTKFKEILDGRVKTLHPKIYASILYNRKKKSHIKTFNKLNIPKIDFIIINLYPFKNIIKNSSIFEDCIEMIDIGGSTLLRSAAKNYEYITVISSINDYNIFIKNLKTNNGSTTLKFRELMAKKVFKMTADYDHSIANWMIRKDFKSSKINNNKSIKLKYGENPNQKSKYILNTKTNSLFKEKIQGKEIGYNNILDLDAGLNCIEEFNEPTCVIIKHNNPCGVASNKSINISFKNAHKGDKISAFGGIVIFNRIVNKNLALDLYNNFFEIIAAKKFTKSALEIFKNKSKLILIKKKKIRINKKAEIRRVIGGHLLQKKNLINISKKNLSCVSKKKISTKKIEDLIFAYKVSKHVKSNAIVLVKDKKTIGIGAGQMSRIDATKLALSKINKIHKKNNFVAASDAFFPFVDSIKKLHNNKCSAIIQPSGSINDEKIIKFANKKKLSVYFTNYRVFKH